MINNLKSQIKVPSEEHNSQYLTTAQIERLVTAHDIYSKYLDGYEQGKRKNYSSPFKEDKNPSLSIFVHQSTKKLWYKCHATGKTGNMYQFVADIYDLDCKTQFNKVLQQIVKDLGLLVKPSENGNNSPLNVSKRWLSTYHAFTKEALDYWQSFGIDQKLLNKYNVKQLAQLTYTSDKGKKSQFRYQNQNIFAFDFVVNSRHKLYVPKQTGVETKYFAKTQTKDDIFGLVELQRLRKKVTKLLIVEGEKDALCCIAKGFNAVSFQAATTMPTRQQMKVLKRISNNLILCYDNDDAGQKAAQKIGNKYNIPIHKIPESYNDIADYLPKVSKNQFEEEIKETLNQWKKENNIHIWEHNKCYWKYKGSKDDEILSKVSNFVIEIEALIKGSEQSFRIVRIQSNGQKSEPFIVNTDVFTSPQKFAEFIERKGDFIFFGDKRDLLAIKQITFRYCDSVNEVPTIGFCRKSQSFVFSNGMIKDGQFIQPNDLGIIEDVFIPSASTMTETDGNYTTQRKYQFKNGSTYTLLDWIANLYEIYGNKGKYIGFSFVFASLFFDVISKKINFFPLLNAYGKKGTGKTSFATTLLGLFAQEPERTSLQAATATGFIRKLEQTANIPQHFDEYLNSIKSNRIEFLKNIYDLIGKTMATKSNDARTKQGKIYSPCIVTGQEPPIINEALLSRFILIEFDTDKHTDRQKKYFKALEVERVKGLGNILIEMLSYREYVRKDFDSEFELTINDIYEIIKDKDVKPSTRTVKNYAVLLAPLRIAIKNGLKVQSELSPSEQIELVNDVLTYHLIEQSKEEAVNEDTATFWQLFDTMVNDGTITEGFDFVVNHQKNELYFRSSVFDKFRETYYRINQSKALDKRTLQGYLKNEPYFKERGVNKYFSGLVKSNKMCKSYVFHLDLLEKIGIGF